MTAEFVTFWERIADTLVRGLATGGAHPALVAHSVLPQSALSFWEWLLTLLTDPNVAYLLFVLGLLGLIGEIVTAGTYVPGAFGTIALLLALISLGQLPTNWGAAGLITLAVALFLVDLKVPGHALSVGGVLVFLVGSLLIFTPFWMTTSDGLNVHLNPWVVAWTTLGVAAFFFLGVAAAWRSRRAPLAVGRETMVGRTGVVSRALDPQGFVHLDGEEWSAVAATDGASLLEGERVRVISLDGLTLYVEAVPTDEVVITFGS